MTAHPIQVICPDCEQMIAIVNRQASVWAALDNHTCQHHHPRGNTMSAQPLRPVPTTGKRPHSRELVAHDDPRIARAAGKVMAAIAALDEAWTAYSAKAELRAERDRLKRQLADVEAALRAPASKPAQQTRDWKQIRAWAADNNIDCPATGKVPNAVVDAYDQAHG